MKALQLKIHGLVQGVFFRKYTREKAIELGLYGTVRNDADGTVQIHVEGREEAVDDFVQWCHHGPSRANVTKVDIHETRLKNSTGFIILKA